MDSTLCSRIRFFLALQATSAICLHRELYSADNRTEYFNVHFNQYSTSKGNIVARFIVFFWVRLENLYRIFAVDTLLQVKWLINCTEIKQNWGILVRRKTDLSVLLWVQSPKKEKKKLMKLTQRPSHKAMMYLKYCFWCKHFCKYIYNIYI